MTEFLYRVWFAISLAWQIIRNTPDDEHAETEHVLDQLKSARLQMSEEYYSDWGSWADYYVNEVQKEVSLEKLHEHLVRLGGITVAWIEQIERQENKEHG